MRHAFDHVEAIARKEGAETLVAVSRAHLPARMRFLEGRGYREERRERMWELNLLEQRERLLGMAKDSRDQMGKKGIELLTLAQWDEPDTYRKLYELDMTATADIPSTETFVPHAYENWKLWFTKPGLYLDRFWLARQGDRLLGLSVLLFPERGPVVTDFTGVARQARGLGIARALKLETVAQAVDQLFDRE